ncbi:MarR family winged helix-turn-helix transcriptional regulator [Olsenella sp. Marseille-P4559]|uniref:MarR family winged helix-turn-helix transcriptional regulator n=1 Tax=Olsenella sp. Marseille-P4559 TaxID=2364795 RepID=UPI00102FAD02|nr:MarR family transcriptional regulator [Olsenella sp. Marseille-P4559]
MSKSYERHAQDLGPSLEAGGSSVSGVDVSDSVAFVSEISRLLSNTYDSIDRLEELTRRSHGIDLSVSELNLIEVVGRRTLHRDETIGMSDIARALDIKVPSATSSVSRLVRKGYVERHRDSSDARRVNVALTRRGEKVYRLHAVFNCRMAQEVSGGLTISEREVLLDGIRRLEHFYAEAQRAQLDYLNDVFAKRGGER